jgi:hypothetical protein
MADRDKKGVTAPFDRVFANDVDWHLQLLVENANDFGIEVPITLFVPGGVVAGIVTSGKVYFELFAEHFAAGWPEEVRAEIQASMATPAEVYPRLEPGEKSPRKIPARFIHLRDAQLVSLQGNLPAIGEGMLWRGALAAVSGYSLGWLTPLVPLTPRTPAARRKRASRAK